MINVLKVYKSCWHEWRLLHNLVSIFQLENVSSRKRENKVEYFQHHSTDFHEISTEMIALWLTI